MSCSSLCGFCGVCSSPWDEPEDFDEPNFCEYCGFESCEGGCCAHIEALEDEAAEAAYDARIDAEELDSLGG